jgi:hypothetical protein
MKTTEVNKLSYYRVREKKIHNANSESTKEITPILKGIFHFSYPREKNMKYEVLIYAPQVRGPSQRGYAVECKTETSPKLHVFPPLASTA